MANIIPISQWTNGGQEVLVVRFCGHDGSSYKGFKHPTKVGEAVTAPDWNTKPECGGGIHGWAWGLGLGNGKDCDWNALWQVYGVAPPDVVAISEECCAEAKIKFRTGTLRFIGDWHVAMLFVLTGQIAWVQQAASGAASATGASGAASATGYSGSASATGYSGSASATGASSVASTGIVGRARAGEFGCIAIAWWNEQKKRSEMRCALVGSGKNSLKPNVWYELDGKGHFVEVER